MQPVTLAPAAVLAGRLVPVATDPVAQAVQAAAHQRVLAVMLTWSAMFTAAAVDTMELLVPVVSVTSNLRGREGLWQS